MKFGLFLFVSAFGLLAHASDLPCKGNQEAQFIANYNHVDLSYAEAGNIEHTTFDLRDFRLFQPSGVCPLDISQAMNAVITLPGIINSIHSGAEVSGVLVYNPNFNMYWIE